MKMYRQFLLFVLIQQTAAFIKVCLKYERTKEGIFSDYKSCPKSTLSWSCPRVSATPATCGCRGASAATSGARGNPMMKT